jgi:hypothetical protein
MFRAKDNTVTLQQKMEYLHVCQQHAHHIDTFLYSFVVSLGGIIGSREGHCVHRVSKWQSSSSEAAD